MKDYVESATRAEEKDENTAFKKKTSRKKMHLHLDDDTQCNTNSNSNSNAKAAPVTPPTTITR